jgi:hypothetical protein
MAMDGEEVPWILILGLKRVGKLFYDVEVGWVGGREMCEM